MTGILSHGTISCMNEFSEEKTEEKEVITNNNFAPVRALTKSKVKYCRHIIVLLVVIVIFIALEFTGTTNFIDNSGTVAMVNGEKITQSELDIRLNQIVSAQFLSLDDPAFRAQLEKQTLDEIINTRLLIRAATKAGYTASDEEVQTEYDATIKQFKGEGSLIIELERSAIGQKEFLDSIRDQIIIRKYVDENSSPASLIVTEEEIKAWYARATSGLEGGPTFEDLRSNIESQLLLEKEARRITATISRLREEADIVITPKL